MKAELEAPGPLRGVTLIAETEEEAKELRNLWFSKSRASWFSNAIDKSTGQIYQATLCIAPTEEE